jgi:hypothetical protein
MKNVKQIALGLMVGAMAIGFSSFTNSKPVHKKGQFANYVFVHPAANANDAKAQYIYDSTPGSCTNSSNSCKATWSQSAIPAEGDNPASDATLVSRVQGTYQAN